ncbi:tRNA splicing endonuclease subunit sen2 [Lithohypha guttulata]|uniref:tRNA splicing endonuclease subunit sen2 n=1 Tax=Lithohypha guttulata TaxID=1690604 RepID=UPI002DDE0405|nr:tRNA splicing endonuclease subunit sen2 [Lithohypha guttulata]
MSEVTIHPRPIGRTGAQKKNSMRGGRRPNYNIIHRNLLPVEVHPLPPLIPHNPLSLVSIALSYIISVLAPPKRKVYKGYFSSATSSIHITDHETQRALWEQGFFGRGSLSRSEPTWLETRKKEGVTAEENTDKRRRERRNFKIERAKVEQAEIEKDLTSSKHDERRPRQILQISRSVPNVENLKTNAHDMHGIDGILNSLLPRRDPTLPQFRPDAIEKPSIIAIPSPKILDLKEEDGMLRANGHVNGSANGAIDGFEDWKKAMDRNGLPTPPSTSPPSETSQAEKFDRPVRKLQRQKTVRFSPTIEAREFDLSSPVISPIKAPGSSLAQENKTLQKVQQIDNAIKENNQEHLQISLEEAFFLTYSLGILEVHPSPSTDPEHSGEALPPSSLLSLFRRHSFFPPRSLSMASEPDDPFMLSYAAYHHFRSMGWVVRSGIKFGVDYLLYNRGPAFSHAEFAVIIIPSYSDPHWSDTEQQKKSMESKTRKSWWWLHGINRVQAQVLKSLVLCYVEVPPPSALKIEKGAAADISALFSKYTVRDVNVKRWTPNRSRD